MHLLHLDASPRPTSVSRLVSAAFADAWRTAAPGGGYTHRDLAADPVPHIGLAWTEICDNLMADEITDLDRLHEGARTPEQREAWAVLAPLLAELVAAEVVLIGTPMYNYSVPSGLKAWIDQVTFPRMDLGHRRFVVVAARGGSYGPGSPKASREHQTTYLSDLVQGHFGVPAPTVVTADLANSRVDPRLAGARQEHEASVEAALAAARRAALTALAARTASGAAR